MIIFQKRETIIYLLQIINNSPTYFLSTYTIKNIYYFNTEYYSSADIHVGISSYEIYTI